jgi:hypothetical protein
MPLPQLSPEQIHQFSGAVAEYIETQRRVEQAFEVGGVHLGLSFTKGGAWPGLVGSERFGCSVRGFRMWGS